MQAGWGGVGGDCPGETLVVTRRAERAARPQNSSAFCVCLFLAVIYKPSKPWAHSRPPQSQAEPLHLTHVCPLCLPARSSARAVRTGG